MLSSPYFRPLLRALTGLIFSVSGLLVLTLILLFTEAPTSSLPDNPPGFESQPTRPGPQKVRPAGYESGKTLFINNCAQCHATTEEVIVGPGLLGVRQRTPGDAWLQKWIRNSSSVIASGDPYAVALYAKFNRVQMTSFSQFTDGQINDLLSYIDAVGQETRIILVNGGS